MILLPITRHEPRQSELARVSVNRQKLLEILHDPIEDDANSEYVIIGINSFSISVESEETYGVGWPD